MFDQKEIQLLMDALLALEQQNGKTNMLKNITAVMLSKNEQHCEKLLAEIDREQKKAEVEQRSLMLRTAALRGKLATMALEQEEQPFHQVDRV